MPAGFRPAATIEAEAAQKKLDRLRDRWIATRQTWFDGTPKSVDRRIGWLDEVITTAKSTASRLYASSTGANAMSLLPQLRADRLSLVSMREELLTGACAGPECTGVQPLSRERVHQMRDERNQWREEQPVQPPHRHEDMGFSTDDVARLKSRQAAREFIEDQNTTDRQELLIRAQRAVEARTSGWTLSASQDAVREFLTAVDEQIPHPVRTARRAPGTETVADFEDHLMFS